MEHSGIRMITWTVSAENFTVERFLRAKGCSHHVLTLLKHTDHGILLNGIWAYGNQKVKPGDEITIRMEEPAGSGQILPVPLPLCFVYEDEDVLVVDKPADMPVHPSAGNYENTLANAVMYYYTSKGIPFVFRCITRLDRDTTGLVLLAKNSLSGAILSDCSARRQIHREYLAIVEGKLPKSGTIDAPIARLEGSPLMRCVDFQNGERAVTHYQRLAVYQKRQDTSVHFEGPAVSGETVPLGKASVPGESPHTLPEFLSLACVRLETGRTHQIRVHMKYIGHPLPGDFLYNPDSVSAFTPRQALHSRQITFAHPITGETLSFVSGLPADMRRLLEMYECCLQET